METEPLSRTDQRRGGSHNGVLLASVLTTVASVYPGFLAGALGPELRTSLGIGEEQFGFVVSSFFFGSSLGSAVLGRIGERVGAPRMITVALTATGIASALIAALASTATSMIAGLFVAGMGNAASQTAANKLLGQSIEPSRLGFAMAVKQSGMPSATMLSGLAVPVIALTVGWRWAYVASTVLAATAIAVVRRQAPDPSMPIPMPMSVPMSMSLPMPAETAGERAEPAAPRPPSSRQTLLIAAVASLFGATAAGTLGNWFTSSAVDAGWSSGRAGLLLSVASVAAITNRLLLGRRADRTDGLPVRTAGLVLGTGAIGAALLAPRTGWTHILGSVLAIGVGWSWPGLMNFGIVRRNRTSASAATGITQTGVYIGVFGGPIAMGFMVERWGYGIGWAAIAVSMTVGALIMHAVAPRFAD